ncbi:MAG: cysteine--tRNA ligase [Alphaproteobacteria bacterium]|nr:cysteine--tRNA ligase [Alphaproteobacteria bacterium]
MPLHLTNTLTRTKEAFKPQDPTRVTMYLCGPTVYDYAHIGNARPAVVFDVLFRLLRRIYGEAHVVFARNITDIDDKIILAASRLGEPIATVTERFAAIYREDTAGLGVLPPTIEPLATAHIGEMIDLISRLIEKGYAYANPTGVNFHVPAMADYGKLSGRAQEDLEAGARVEVDEAKRNPADFALWKAAKPGEPAWDSPWGPGRPGWHIECSAMAGAHLGETIDIHAGGHDLIFPHHENEIAQSECATGKPFARYWVHNGFLDFDGEKMSKSTGNVARIHELRALWPSEVLRWALLSAHYRAPLDWNEGLLDQSKAALDRLYRALQRVKAVKSAAAAPSAGFLEALEDDLATPRALAELFGLASALNKSEDPDEQAMLKAQILAGGALMGLLQSDPDAWFRGAEDEAAEIDALVAARTAARAARDFAEADRLRGELTARGVEIMDGAGGSTWRRIG